MDIVHLDIRHAAELADLMNRNCDLESRRFTPELIRGRLWEYPHMASAVRLGVLDGGRLVGAMAGSSVGAEGFIRLFAVDQTHRRQGLARRMLDQVENELRSRGAMEVAALYAMVGYILPGLDARYTPAFCMLENHGYQRQDVVVNMLLPLRPNETLIGTMVDRSEYLCRQHGVTIRRAEPHDRDQMSAWTNRHFPGAWVTEVDVTFSFDPIPLWIALRNGGVAGFAAYDVNMFLGGFGPTGVDESLRGMGIGAALLWATLADMRRRGYEECEIAWLGPVGFYSHVCGARINRTFLQLSKKL